MMADTHGLAPAAHIVGAAGISGGATSPPPRPAIPPKPDKDKISSTHGSKSNAGVQANIPRRRHSAADATASQKCGSSPPSGFNPVRSEGGCCDGDTPHFRSPVTSSSTDFSSSSPQSPSNNPVFTPSTPGDSPGRAKPALPPKPASSSLLSSPPLTKFPPKSTPPQIPSPPTNNGSNHSSGTEEKLSMSNGEHLNGNVGSPPPFLRHKPPQPPGDPLSPRIVLRGFEGPRPNSSNCFNFSSPIQNLNSANFPSTHGGLHRPPSVLGLSSQPPPQPTLAQIRVKSASLGRNFQPPPSETPSRFGGIFSRKSATLSKFLPLDLHLGSARTPPPLPANKPKPNLLNLNPFIQQEQRQQASKPQFGDAGQQHPVQSFGRQISFSPDSPLPPPPPPRLKKKLSPVSSLGSPTSPTSPISPSPLHSGLTSQFSLPPPPPVSPGMEVLSEVCEESEGRAIYAAVDMEKKRADRKLKQQSAPPMSSSSPVTVKKIHRSSPPPQHTTQSIISPPLSSHNSNNQINSEKPDSSSSVFHTCPEDDENDNHPPATTTTTTVVTSIQSAESAVVDSWLGKYLHNPVTSAGPTPVRATSPTYLSRQTGHIYETIGDSQLGDGNNNKTNSNQASQVISKDEDDNLSENRSFLFTLVIGQKKSEQSESTSHHNDKLEDPAREETATKQSSVTGEQQTEETVAMKVASFLHSSPQAPNKEAPPEDVLLPSDETMMSTYLIPTVVQDLSAEKAITTQTESNGVDQKGVVSPPQGSEGGSHPLLTDDSSFTSQTSVNTDSTVGSTPVRTSSLRRNSWGCDRVGSPSFSDSSSTTSSIASSNLPYHKRDRSYTGPIRGNGLEEWIDEGELSTGALADAEGSDVQLRGSAEDVLARGAVGGKQFPSPKVGFVSRRTRLVNSIFNSFGKGSSSSSGGGDRKSAMRPSNAIRRKEKAISQVYTSDPLKNQDVGVSSKWGRQISDSVIPTTAAISGPVLTNSSFTIGGPPLKTPSVQFSQEVPETRLIYPEHSSSSEAVVVGPVTSPPSGGSLPSLEGRDDNESVSSSESVSGSGSSSGYEDILAELSPREKKSFYVAREILTSERTFVDVLNLLTIDFPKYVRNAAKFRGEHIISDNELDAIMGGLPTLKQLNEDLLSDLDERVAHWRENPKVADILVKKGSFLKMYASYIKDFQKNTMALDSCCKSNRIFAETLKEFEQSDRCQKLGLKHYMLKPVQRMPQYRLLLEDYLKSLDKESEDYEDAVKGIAIVKDVAEHANETITLQVNAEKLLHLQSRLAAGTVILKADRQMLKDGELKKVCRKVLQPRFFALMNDHLLCFVYIAGAGSPKDLKLRYELPLAGMRVSLSPAEDYQHEFSVISVTRSFNLVANSSKERDDWMHALNSAINDNIRRRTCGTPDQEIGFQLGKEAPVWVQDSRVTMCQLCTAEFTTMFRRHHCRACGKVVCGNCSGNQAPLKYLQNSSARVCDSCYEHLLDEFDNCRSSTNESDRLRASVREKFKKVTPNVSKRATKMKSKVPARLEVHANSSGSRISGYLQWREREKKSWKRRWFVLIDRVLYIYAASEDIVAIKSVPILGWNVELDTTDVPHQDGEDPQTIFKLTHLGQDPILFQADSVATAEKWIAAMSEVVVL